MAAMLANGGSAALRSRGEGNGWVARVGLRGIGSPSKRATGSSWSARLSRLAAYLWGKRGERRVVVSACMRADGGSHLT